MSVTSLRPSTGPVESERPTMRLVASGARESLSGLDDNARFRSVVMPHIDDAYRLAHWVTRNRPDAEGVVQDAAVHAVRATPEVGSGSGRALVPSIVRHNGHT